MPYTNPSRPANFVAYQAEPVLVGGSDGTSVELRPSTFVREYPSIKVAAFEAKEQTNSRGHFATAYVTFDAVSAGVERLAHNFSASVLADTEVFNTLREAHKTGEPVSVAIECVRKARNTDGKIDPRTPIHELRGAKPDGVGGNANITGTNCVNKIVGAAPTGAPTVFSPEVSSDPDEWPGLRENRSGELPPPGFRIFDGGIVPVETGVKAAGFDVAALADLIAARVAGKPQTPSVAQRPAPRTSHASEAREWEAYNSDGRVNLGSYMVSAARYALLDANDLLAETWPQPDSEHHAKVEGIEPHAFCERLADLLLWMADQVQVRTYGNGARPNRHAKSHREAAQWVKAIYERSDPMLPVEAIYDQAARRQWSLAVVEAATGKFAAAARLVEGWLNRDGEAEAAAATPAAQPARGAAGRQDSPQSKPEPAAPERAPEPAVAAPDLASVVARWEALLAATGKADNPRAFAPLLDSTLGTSILSDVSPEDFDVALRVWESDHEVFAHEASAAWHEHDKAVKASA